MEQYAEFTSEELEKANSASLVDYLSRRGERLVKSGREYRWVYTDSGGKHDSVTVRDNEWYDHKNQVGGKAIDFLRQKLGFCFKEAIQELIGRNVGMAPIFISQASPLTRLKAEFLLPEINSDMHRVFAYLIKQRYLAPWVISYFAHEKMLYEDKEHHNAVFVGFDKDGVPKHAHKRGTASFGSAYRGTVEGSEPAYPFCHIGTSPKLFVFEAPIDMLSFITLNPKDWQKHSYVALCGVAEQGMTARLKEYPHLREVVLCLDNDTAGIDAADRLTDILHGLGYGQISRLSSRNKDWNEDLIEENGGTPKPAVPHLRKELFSEETSRLQYRPSTDLKKAALRIEHCRQDYFATGDRKSLKKIAEHSASAMAVIAQRMNPEIGNEFERIQEQLLSEYRAYKDKGTIEMKKDALNKAVKEVMKDSRNIPSRTPDEYKVTSGKYQSLCYQALALYVETHMDETPENELASYDLSI